MVDSEPDVQKVEALPRPPPHPLALSPSPPSHTYQAIQNMRVLSANAPAQQAAAAPEGSVEVTIPASLTRERYSELLSSSSSSSSIYQLPNTEHEHVHVAYRLVRTLVYMRGVGIRETVWVGVWFRYEAILSTES